MQRLADRLRIPGPLAMIQGTPRRALRALAVAEEEVRQPEAEVVLARQSSVPDSLGAPGANFEEVEDLALAT